MIKEYKDYRIALTGSAGSGKTTLMNDWSQHTGAPVVRVSVDTVAPVDCRTHRDIIKLGANQPQAGIDLQLRIATARFKLFESTQGGFISDRAVVDSMAYYGMHNSPFSDDISYDDEYASLTMASTLDQLDLTLQLAPDVNKMTAVEDNGIRITSPLYFKIVSETIRSLLVDIMDAADEPLSTSVLAIDDKTNALVAINSKTAVARLLESNWENGIAPREVRVKAIERILDFIKLNRGK